MLEQIKNQIEEQFYAIFGSGFAPKICFAPGRVNLIGEHTDYNGGYVLPGALSMGTYACGRNRRDEEVNFYSCNYPNEELWKNYPKAVITIMEEEFGRAKQGMDLLFWGTIPTGSGLSSSASLEVCCGYLISKLWGIHLDKIQLAQLCRRAENELIGVQCGIMDQFASAMGKKDYVIGLNTGNLQYEYATAESQEYEFVIVNSMVKHSLADSQYNERRKECRKACEILSKYRSVSQLCELTVSEFEQYKSGIEDCIIQKRAEHVIYENERTKQGIAALNRKDFKQFGVLMNQSHDSLKELYQVSCEEIDFLVEEAGKMDGVLGSRITGGGFGGCTIHLIDKKIKSNFQENLKQLYLHQYNKKIECYSVQFEDGVHCLQ
ncbi:MAG: galactokinase [Lachnospiraceae bacterium]